MSRFYLTWQATESMETEFLLVASVTMALLAGKSPASAAATRPHHSSMISTSHALNELDEDNPRDSILPKLRFTRTIFAKLFAMATCVDCHCITVCRAIWRKTESRHLLSRQFSSAS